MVVEIDSVSCKLVKLTVIFLSIYFHSSRDLFSQNALFEILDKFLDTPQLEVNALFQNSQ